LGIFFFRIFGTLYFLDDVMGVSTGAGYLDLSIFVDGIRDVPPTTKFLSSVLHPVSRRDPHGKGLRPPVRQRGCA